jgi:hypothetical protein
VAKAPLSAAGRLRLRGGRDGELTGAERTYARRLLELQGLLVVEPWVERVEDFGVAGGVFGTSRVDVRSIHRLEVDRAGRFVGITAPVIDLDAGIAMMFGAAAALSGEALRAAGYAGPFGIDGYLYGNAREPGIQCISEINARMTFGLVARKIISTAQTWGEIAEDAIVSLRFGRGAPPDGSIPLLLPGDDDETSAWLKVPPRHAS